MLQNFTKTYIDKDYAHHRAEILWKREESYLPATMERVERVNEGRRIQREVLRPLHIERRLLSEELDKLNKKLRENELIMWRIQRDQVDPLLRGDPPIASGTAAAQPTERQAFVRKCTVPNCNGWLSSAWKCAVCENYSCPDCFAVKGKQRDAEHTCDPDEKATADLLRKDTKPCPNCGTGIQRTQGCPVMFCTGCHKGFNWNTMQIINHGIHNPHYYEWRAANGGGRPREVGDIPCGGVPDDRFIWLMTKSPERTYVTNMHRVISHVADYELRRFAPTIDRLDVVNLRTRFLLGEVSKEAAEKELYRDEKKAELRRVIYDIMNTCAVAGADCLRGIERAVIRAAGTNTRAREVVAIYPATGPSNEALVSAWKSFRTDADALLKFINRSFLEVGELYGPGACMLFPKGWAGTPYQIRHMQEATREQILGDAGYAFVNSKIYNLSHTEAPPVEKPAKKKAKAAAAPAPANSTGGGAGGPTHSTTNP